jgi:hypothetical protein
MKLHIKLSINDLILQKETILDNETLQNKKEILDYLIKNMSYALINNKKFEDKYLKVNKKGDK